MFVKWGNLVCNFPSSGSFHNNHMSHSFPKPAVWIGLVLMRSRRVIVRLAPYVLTFGLLGSTLAWQDIAAQRVDEDLGTPRVVVDQQAHDHTRVDREHDGLLLRCAPVSP